MDAPETYEDAITAPAAKQRRFTHEGLSGSVDAVEVDGITYYNTKPPEYASYDIVPYRSQHRTWVRPGFGHQAPATSGSGHQASATSGLGHQASATTQ